MGTKRKIKNEHFQVIQESNAARNWNAYLELQVQLFARTEFELFVRKGLNKKLSPILDLGCGPGIYSRALRAWDSTIKIVGADTNLALLERFRESLKKKPDSGIQVVHWPAGKVNAPEEISKCKAAVLRYILQHNDDPEKVLRAVSKQLPKGALIFIVEEDDGLFQFEPDFAAFRELLEIWKKWANEYQTDRFIGRKVPSIAANAGLKVIDCEILCHTHYKTGLDPLLKYFMLSFGIISETAPKVLSAEEAKKLTKDFQIYRNQFGKNGFFYYPQVVTIAQVK